MIQSYFTYVHEMGIHLYTIPCVILVVIMAVVLLVHTYRAARDERIFRDELEQIGKEAADEAAPGQEGGF